MKRDELSLPIVFIHEGSSWYPPYAVYQARMSNPNSEVVFLGTKNPNLGALCRFVNMATFIEGAEQFTRVYQHFSTNAASFELSCIRRWFVLLEWMRHEKVERCFFVDSDVLIFTNVTQDQVNYSKAELTYIGSDGT